jgi:hypothetical protein
MFQILSEWLLKKEEMIDMIQDEKDHQIHNLEAELNELRRTKKEFEGELELVNAKLKEIEADEEENRMPIVVMRSRPFLRSTLKNATSAPLLASFGMKSISDIVNNESAWSYKDKNLLVSLVDKMKETSGLYEIMLIARSINQFQDAHWMRIKRNVS